MAGALIWGAVIALALLLAAFYLGADWIGAKKYADGFVAGQLAERVNSDEKMEMLRATLKAEGLALQKRESDRAREIQRIQQAASEAARVEYAESYGAARTELARVLARVRAVETFAAGTTRRAIDRSRMSAAAGAAEGTDGAAACGALPDGRREAAARLMAEADDVAAKYLVCLRTGFPQQSKDKP